jgi:hypothetical protein
VLLRTAARTATRSTPASSGPSQCVTPAATFLNAPRCTPAPALKLSSYVGAGALGLVARAPPCTSNPSRPPTAVKKGKRYPLAASDGGDRAWENQHARTADATMAAVLGYSGEMEAIYCSVHCEVASRHTLKRPRRMTHMYGAVDDGGCEVTTHLRRFPPY